MLSELSLTEEQLEVPKAHQDIRNAYEKVVASQLDLARAEAEVTIMSTPEGARAKIDKYKGVLSKDN
jgi:hypothetical protein